MTAELAGPRTAAGRALLARMHPEGRAEQDGSQVMALIALAYDANRDDILAIEAEAAAPADTTLPEQIAAFRETDTVEQVAARFGVSRRTIYNWIAGHPPRKGRFSGTGKDRVYNLPPCDDRADALLRALVIQNHGGITWSNFDQKYGECICLAHAAARAYLDAKWGRDRFEE